MIEVHDNDFLVLPHLLKGTPTIVDVGANLGQSINSFKSIWPEAIVHSFEPNPGLISALKAIADRCTTVTVYQCGLGSKEEVRTFFMPVVDGKRFVEESAMDLAEFEKPWIKKRLADRGKDLRFWAFKSHVRVGDTFGINPQLMKVDVEGAELEVLKGFEETIKRSNPVIIAENSDWARVTTYLEALGYKAYMPDRTFERVVPFSGERVNTIYLGGRGANDR